MTTLTKTRKTIATAAAFMLAMTASMIIFDTAHGASSVSVTQSTEDGSNSVRVTQSTEDGLEVECEGNLKCEIIDNTVVATSKQNDNNAVTTTMTQSNPPLDIDDINAINQDVAGMVSTILDQVFDNPALQLGLGD